MIGPQQIQQVSAEIARRFHPERILLFGSYAYGNPTEDSDVDLLVIMPLKAQARTRRSRSAWRFLFPFLRICLY